MIGAILIVKLDAVRLERDLASGVALRMSAGAFAIHGSTDASLLFVLLFPETRPASDDQIPARLGSIVVHARPRPLPGFE